jgi:hypothetical protein
MTCANTISVDPGRAQGDDMEHTPASFYLGKEYDVEQRQLLPKPVLYDACDLTTHAVCLGMTGSGKTGLCITLLEEAALDGVPAIIIDPKGDLANLLLTFPEMRPTDLQPWVNVDDARREGRTLEEHATAVASLWRQGLGEWGLVPQRIADLRDAAEFLIFTPGSNAGLAVNIMHTLKAPQLSWKDEEETLRDKVQATVSAVLRLVGIAADPVKSREHILLANLFEHAWRAGEDLDLAKLIQRIQDPPLAKLGVFDVNAFFPRKERIDLAVTINSIIAAPSFENWLEGRPLDVDALFHREDSKPRLSIFYLAHLSDSERMFFVTLLLAQIEAWMRRQPGTTGLRCIVHFDEVFGYFPPHPANPPSKLPLLRLLKQARAYGVGLMLTTQNPVDLDYKGLTNAGTWFIGKLQTERDKARLLEGLEGLQSTGGQTSMRAYFDRLISSLGKRVFIMHNVHQKAPVVFKTRWALSYLRGPLTKTQVRTLMKAKREQLRAAPLAAPAPSDQTPHAEPPGQPAKPEKAAEHPGLARVAARLPAEVSQYFLEPDTPARRALRFEERRQGILLRPLATHLVYQPGVLGWASLLYEDARRHLSHTEERCYWVPPPEDLNWLDWTQGRFALRREDLSDAAPADALFVPPPAALHDAKRWRELEKDWVNFLYREARLTLFHNARLRLYSEVGESEGRFVQRCQEQAKALQQEDEDKITRRFQAQMQRLEERMRREERELYGDRIELDGRKRETRLTIGESILGILTGRRRLRTFSEVSRRRRLVSQAKADVEESEEVLDELEQDAEQIHLEHEEALRELAQRTADLSRHIEQVHIGPKKSNIDVIVFGLAWVPTWQVTYGDASRAERTVMLPAYRGPAEESS